MINRSRRHFVAFEILAFLLAGSLAGSEIGTPARVSVIQTPNGGSPEEAAISPDGIFHLIYHSDSDGIPYYVKSADHGATFSSRVPMVEQTSRQPGLVFYSEAMAVGKGGAIYVAMSTNNWKMKLAGVPDGLLFATLQPGARAFTPVRSLNGQPSEGFSLAADGHGNGNVVATWLANKLYVNFSRDGGATFTANAELNKSYDPCDCCTTRAVYGADGSLAVLYREKSNDERDMYVVIVKKDGRQLRTRISSTLWKVNACPMSYYSLSATEDGYVAAWPTKGEIYFSRLDRDGKVVAPGEIRVPGRTGMRTGLIALGAPDREALVAWKDKGQLNWQLYSHDGRPEGGPGSAPSSGKGTAGLVDSGGRFVLFR
jgi:hypothetical protein